MNNDKPTTPEELAYSIWDYSSVTGEWDEYKLFASALIAETFERWRRERPDWVEAELTQAHIDKWHGLTLARAEAAEARVRELEQGLRDWQAFGGDVATSDCAGQDWLDELRARTDALLKEARE